MKAICSLCNEPPSRCGKRPDESAHRRVTGEQPVGDFLCSCGRRHNGTYGSRCEDCWVDAQRLRQKSQQPVHFRNHDIGGTELGERCIHAHATCRGQSLRDCGNCARGISVRSFMSMQFVIVRGG